MFKYVETDEHLDQSREAVSQVEPESTDPILTDIGENDTFISDEKKFLVKDETVFSDIQEMNEQITSMISKSDVFLTGPGREGRRASKCNMCGKVGTKSLLRVPIEAHHINAIRRECDICGKSFKTRNALASHKAIQHKGHFF